MKDIAGTIRYFIKEIDHYMNWWLMSNKHTNVCTILNYIEHFLIWASAVTECISISASSSLLSIHIKTTSSTIGLKLCATAEGIKKHKSIIKKMKKKHDEIALLAKTKLNSI